MAKRGILFIVSAPSGAGKTTLCNSVLHKCKGLKLSVSHTTRKPRQGEIDGLHYFFVKENIFTEMISRGEFIEWARVHNNLYGTSKNLLEEMVIQGFDVILDIDVQGGKQIKEIFPESVLIFILPPSIDILRERLMNRMSDAENEIIRRLSKARDEIRDYIHYDYVIVNDNIKDAVDLFTSIIIAERSDVARANHEWIAKKFFEVKI